MMMTMRRRIALLLVSMATTLTSASDPRRKYETEAAPEFLFERRVWQSDCVENKGTSFIIAGRQAPSRRTRLDELMIPRNQVPALTIGPDLYSSVRVEGSARDGWRVQFCAVGEGRDEAEASQHLKQTSISRTGGMLFTQNSVPFDPQWYGRGSLSVEGPADAPIVVDAPYSFVEVRDMAGPLRVSASHARASILDTTGRVESSAMVVDFAARRGRVTLSAEAEINLKIKAQRFDGSLLAWAQRSVKVLVPPGFNTSFEAMVNKPEDFICRSDFCAKVKKEKKDNLYVFSFAGDGDAKRPTLQLRSEQATIVIDTSSQ